jgi:AcrR family transcriptional regulator
MPTQTFLNLPTQKREAFTRLALLEFADHDYANASLTKIVTRAGIAKGSVYQYFADKQELFLYLVDLAQQTLLGALSDFSSPSPSTDIWVTLRWQMSASVRAAMAYPIHAQLLRRAYTAALPFREEIVARGHLAAHQHYVALLQQGAARGEVRLDLDLELAATFIAAVVNEVGTLLIARLGLTPEEAVAGDLARFDDPRTEQLFDQVIDVLRHGLAS